MSVHLTLSVYRTRINTIYNKLLDNDPKRANLLFDRYANERDAIKVLPLEIDDDIQFEVFQADIFLIAGLVEECKQKLRSVMEMIDRYSLQQATMIRRLGIAYMDVLQEHDALGSLSNLPHDCLAIIAEEVQTALIHCN